MKMLIEDVGFTRHIAMLSQYFTHSTSTLVKICVYVTIKFALKNLPVLQNTTGWHPAE